MTLSLQRITCYLITSVLSINSHAVNAAIFHCVDTAGNPNFQDKPCQKEVKSEIISQPKLSSPSFSSNAAPVSLTNIKAETKALKQKIAKNNKRYKALIAVEKKEKKLKARSYQRDLKLQEKAEKKQVRCQKIQEKIDWIESQLRQGSKFKSHYRLTEELNRYQKMKIRDCQAS